jgi:polyhydroxyalkanoate synthase
MQPGSADALLAAIAQSGNEVTQGWMRVMAGAAAAADAIPSGSAALQRSYFEKQARLWAALASGKRETLATPEPGDRRFAAREWRDNAYYDYLKQSYLLAARYL